MQRQNGHIRVNAGLVGTSDGTTLWSEHFSRQVTDVIAVQNEISGKIAGTLSRAVGVVPLAKSSPATRSPEAYDAYLRGLWHLKGRSHPVQTLSPGPTRGDLRSRSSSARWPLIPSSRWPGRHWPAPTHNSFSTTPPTAASTKRRSWRFSGRWRSIPTLPEAYLARAQLTWTARNRFPHEAAIADLRRALALNANLADAYLELEKVYYHIGLTDKVIAAGEQVQRLDPSRRYPAIERFRALIDAGRLEQMRLDVDRNGNLGPYVRGDALIALGRLQDALQFLSRSKATLPGDAEYDIGSLALLGLVYARLDQPKQAEQVLAMVSPAAENPTALSHIHHAQFHIGATLGLLGRKADAVRWLTKAADEGYPSYPRFSTDQSLAPLKGYPAYEALLVRLRNDWNRWQKTL